MEDHLTIRTLELLIRTKTKCLANVIPFIFIEYNIVLNDIFLFHWFIQVQYVVLFNM